MTASEFVAKYIMHDSLIDSVEVQDIIFVFLPIQNKIMLTNRHLRR